MYKSVCVRQIKFYAEKFYKEESCFYCKRKCGVLPVYIYAEKYSYSFGIGTQLLCFLYPEQGELGLPQSWSKIIKKNVYKSAIYRIMMTSWVDSAMTILSI